MRVVRYDMDRERTERFIIRTTKGLLKHYFPDYDSSQDRWFAHFLGTEVAEVAKYETLRDRLPCFDRRGDRVVSYWFGFLAGGKTGVWLIMFYESVIFMVTHSSSPTLFEGIETCA